MVLHSDAIPTVRMFPLLITLQLNSRFLWNAWRNSITKSSALCGVVYSLCPGLLFGIVYFVNYVSRCDLTKEETSIAEHGFVWCWNLETSESVSEILGKFWDVVLEKDGEDQLGRSYEKLTITQSQGEKQYPTYNKRGRLTGLVTSCGETAF